MASEPYLNGNTFRTQRNIRATHQFYAHVTGWGMAVPERVLTNHELARMVDTTDEWIVSRTGIKQRHIAENDETTDSLAVAAAQEALEKADISPEEVDLIIVATSTPQNFFPATASNVQDALGAYNAGAFDLAAACTGFVYGVTMASQAIQSGGAKVVLVIGAETLSKIVDWEDRSTCILFGDGAGAFVLQAKEQPGGVLSTLLRSDGSGGDLLSVRALKNDGTNSDEALQDDLHKIHMNGREVFRFATRVMTSACREVATAAGVKLDDVAMIVPHQANKRIIDAARRALRFPPEKIAVNVERYGNTSAASIPMAMCEAIDEGSINPNDNVILVAFGGGLTWGATLIQWAATPPPEITRMQALRRQTAYRLARVRSALRRGVRAVEGAIWGAQSPAGVKPPYRERKNTPALEE